MIPVLDVTGDGTTDPECLLSRTVPPTHSGVGQLVTVTQSRPYSVSKVRKVRVTTVASGGAMIPAIPSLLPYTSLLTAPVGHAHLAVVWPQWLDSLMDSPEQLALDAFGKHGLHTPGEAPPHPVTN